MTYKSRIDYYHYALTVFCFTLCALLCAFTICVSHNAFLWVFAVIFLFTINILMYIFYSYKYTFNNNDFIIKSALIEKRIKYNNIRKCYITKNNNLSYATSLKRICIETKDGQKMYISPKKMDEILLLLINRR